MIQYSLTPINSLQQVADNQFIFVLYLVVVFLCCCLLFSIILNEKTAKFAIPVSIFFVIGGIVYFAFFDGDHHRCVDAYENKEVSAKFVNFIQNKDSSSDVYGVFEVEDEGAVTVNIPVGTPIDKYITLYRNENVGIPRCVKK